MRSTRRAVYHLFLFKGEQLIVTTTLTQMLTRASESVIGVMSPDASVDIDDIAM